MSKREFTIYHNRVNQEYEKYWNYTAAFTDFNSEKFIKTLKTCIEFLDAKRPTEYSTDLYAELQKKLQETEGLECTGESADASQRKRINQLVKLGFIKHNLLGYPEEAKLYVDSDRIKTDKRRQAILSKIVYKYANLCDSVTNEDHSQQLKFFLKSLEYIGSFSERDLATIMTIDINSFDKDHADPEDLCAQYQSYDVEGFITRKYNQIDHLKNILGKLEDLTIHDKCIYFKTDADRLFGEESDLRKEVRDPYLQRIYKSELETETMEKIEGLKKPICMMEGLAHPVLIASHIKPYKDCDEREQFDVNNGLLLSKNLDSLFDLGYITFDDNWNIQTADVLNTDLANHIKDYKVKDCFKNEERLHYMEYHRNFVYNKRFAR